MSRAALLVACLAGCVHTSIPKPEGGDLSVLGARVWVEDATHQRSSAAGGVHFVRFEQDGDPTRVAEVLTSQYAQGSNHYRFNLPAGQYALVGCFQTIDGRKVHTYFSEKLIRASIVTVPPRALAFAGDFSVRTSMDLSKLDDAQRHYLRVIDPSLLRKGPLQRMISRTGAQTSRNYRLRRDERAQARFRDRARSLRDAGWGDLRSQD